ncbi:MAG: DUF262 domain-containing protein [Gemmatimonadota bacterium]|nr:DUF262 domain-containing protein [Gemmatimonadota bacterium]
MRATFDSKKTPIEDMLNEVENGKMQLPDFQRGWVWDDHHIRDLIASVSLSFPIGAVMTLSNGGQDVRFKPRPIEGTDASVEQVEPETLILDGQQRLTSLFQSLMAEKPVETRDSKGKAIQRWYYLDIKKCVADGADREDAVISIPEDRRLTKAFGREVVLDLSSPENEYAEDMFPLHKVFDSKKWRRGYNRYWDQDSDKADLWDNFEEQVIDNFEQYHVPVIALDKKTPKEAVCIVFEKVNTGGVTLTVFELLTASFAADDFSLRDDWEARQERLREKHQILDNIESTSFLQALTLISTKMKGNAVSCKRRDILRLTVDDYKKWANDVEDGFVQAARFIHGQKIFRLRDLPYRTQLVPLAAILTDMGGGDHREDIRKKIIRWYWCGVLGEMYSGATETRFANDLMEVTAWVNGGTQEPRTIQDANFQANRLLTLKTRNSAAYKGIYALLMRDGCRDFRSGVSIEEATFFDDNIDIHHIFPKEWCKSHNIDSDKVDSIINKTPISSKTNRSIGKRAPSEYLHILEKDVVDATSMDSIFTSHCISDQALRSDNFNQFFNYRREELIQRIEKAMEKPVVLDEGVF